LLHVVLVLLSMYEQSDTIICVYMIHRDCTTWGEKLDILRKNVAKRYNILKNVTYVEKMLHSRLFCTISKMNCTIISRLDRLYEKVLERNVTYSENN
jgi:hypothetical protein